MQVTSSKRGENWERFFADKLLQKSVLFTSRSATPYDDGVLLAHAKQILR